MYELKITQIGNSRGIILPKEILDRLNVDKGDTVFASLNAEGVQVVSYDPKVAAQVELGRQFMSQYRDTFNELAK